MSFRDPPEKGADAAPHHCASETREADQFAAAWRNGPGTALNPATISVSVCACDAEMRRKSP
jgi:hypothetical protein